MAPPKATTKPVNALAPTKGRHLHLSLLANGLDFIKEGIEALYGTTKPPKRATKYALLHVFSGTLLVLKERLRKAHPSLIFVKVENAGRADAHTVDFDQVLARLEGAAGVKIAHEDRQMLRDVQGERNRLEHYEVHLDIDKMNARIGELVDFLERFLHAELNESLLSHLSRTAAREVGDLAKIAERARKRRYEEWRQRAAPYFDLSKKRLAELHEENSYHPKENPDGRFLFVVRRRIDRRRRRRRRRVHGAGLRRGRDDHAVRALRRPRGRRERAALCELRVVRRVRDGSGLSRRSASITFMRPFRFRRLARRASRRAAKRSGASLLAVVPTHARAERAARDDVVEVAIRMIALASDAVRRRRRS